MKLQVISHLGECNFLWENVAISQLMPYTVLDNLLWLLGDKPLCCSLSGFHCTCLQTQVIMFFCIIAYLWMFCSHVLSNYLIAALMAGFPSHYHTITLGLSDCCRWKR